MSYERGLRIFTEGEMSSRSSSNCLDQSVSIVLSRGLIDVTIKRNKQSASKIQPVDGVDVLKAFVERNVAGADFRADLIRELDYQVEIWRGERALMNQATEQHEPQPDYGYIAFGYLFASAVGFAFGMFAVSLWGAM